MNVKLLKNKVLVKRVDIIQKGIIIELPHFTGEVVTFGKDVENDIEIDKGDTLVYDKYPESIKIEGVEYDLISSQQIKYIIVKTN